MFKYKFEMKKINFAEINISSKEEIISWSSGEVKNSETINYRTLKPEIGGLFCQKIFGPIKNNYCNCSNFKFSNIINDKCNVCNVKINCVYLRRRSMGHINLKSPVVHIWFLKSIPSKLGLIINMKLSKLEKIIYYEKYIVLKSKIKTIKKGTVINEKKYYNYKTEYKKNIKIKTGADAVEYLLNEINLYKEYYKIKKKLKSKKNIKKYYINLERLKIFKSFILNKIKLNIFILKTIPVISPDLRPIVKLNKDKFASSDLNELYKRIITRNNRLKKLFNIGAPEFVVKEEKKLLQESVDCLFDNGRKAKYFKSNNKLFKSLSENIKGKKGRFRQNLLGKRVDYSGRSVIVVEPNMKINYFGIPVNMAFELFRPFIYSYLVIKGFSITYNVAKEEVDMKTNVAFKALKKIIKNRPLILNRAPTLHKLSIQGFYPFLVNTNAIHIHPLVCTAFNADFDGDQMAVHVPISYKAIIETKKLLLPSKNIFNQSNGNISILPTQDIILGLNFLSENVNEKENIYFFNNVKEAKNYYYFNFEKNKKIILRIKKNFYIKTTLRRIFFYSIFPIKKIFFNYNKQLNKKDIHKIINDVSLFVDKEKLLKFILDLTKLGFEFSTKSGISLSINDFFFKQNKKKQMNYYFKIYGHYINEYKKKKILYKKKYEKNINLWNYVINNINFYSMIKIAKKKKMNPLYRIFISGSKGADSNIYQLIGARGLMTRTNGSYFETPIISNFKDGLNSIQYFISSFGARKGLADTAIKTANSGYLTRRLVDIAQDVVINKIDCFTNKFFRIIIENNNYKDYNGFCLSHNLYHKKKLLFNKNSVIDDNLIKKLKKNKITYLNIRNPLTCNLIRGICSKCYGTDFSKKKIVNLGIAVGVIAAQSIGEPGTQLTMRTFHTGGVVSSEKKNKKQKSLYFCFTIFSHYFNFCYKKQYFNKFYALLININGNLINKEIINAGYNKIKNKIKPYYYKNKTFKKKILFCCLGYLKYLNFRKINYVKTKKNYFLQKTSISYIKIFYKNNFLFVPLDYKKLVEIKIKKFFNVLYVKYFSKKYFIGDITNSLELISNIFELRFKKTKEYSNINGVCKKKKKIIEISNFKKIINYHSDKIINFFDNVVLKGESLNNKNNFYNNLNIVGVEKYNIYFRNKISSIYNNYGIYINKKHFDVILKQMLLKAILIKKSKIKYFNLQILRKKKIVDFNFKQKDTNIFKTLISGITKSSLSIHSYISSASFQNTVNVLINASLFQKKDFLLGIKENVILGRLIPSGTGFFNSLYYKKYFNDYKSIN
ncbi:DNA-directed RNA polymerase subunit beta' [Candidatus Vidania fulgoroideorum]